MAKAKLGILMLDTRFPRIPGDVGNPDTWPFAVRYGVVPGATPQAIVCSDPAPFVQAFIAKGQELISDGCTGLATTCGFLALIRPQLAEALGVPVAASALEQAPQILPMLGNAKELGILTISAQNLTDAHKTAAGIPLDAAVVGMEGTRFAQAILENEPELDVITARAEMISAAKRLMSMRPRTGAIILECTNMPPYAADVAQAASVPVFSIYTYLRWFHAGLSPVQFGQ